MRIIFVGAGNVATHLALALDKIHDVVQVYSRLLENAQVLSNKLKNATPTNRIEDISPNADLYVMSVKDDAISQVVDAVTFSSGLWAHTSGSVSIEILKTKFAKSGVLYPLQTFSKDISVEVSQVPFFVEGSDSETETIIENLANELSTIVHKADSSQRSKLHVAAVFGCNFVNYMWSQSSEILNSAGYDFNVLLPLIKVTIDKAIEITPSKGQTGPARRGDIETMKVHEQMLSSEQANLYRILSQSIMKKYNIGNEQN